MGQHTWFCKSQHLNKLEDELDNLVERFGGLVSDDWLSAIDYLSQEIFEENESEFHDCFRTNKRNPDGTYIDDIRLKSKEECFQWLEENKEFVYDLNMEDVLKFWEKYPQGVIKFG